MAAAASFYTHHQYCLSSSPYMRSRYPFTISRPLQYLNTIADNHLCFATTSQGTSPMSPRSLSIKWHIPSIPAHIPAEFRISLAKTLRHYVTPAVPSAGMRAWPLPSVRKTAHRCVFVIPASRGIFRVGTKSSDASQRPAHSAAFYILFPHLPHHARRSTQMSTCSRPPDDTRINVRSVHQWRVPMTLHTRCCITQNFLSYAYIASFSFRNFLPFGIPSPGYFTAVCQVAFPTASYYARLAWPLNLINARVYIRELSSHSSRRSGPVPAQIRR